MLEILSLMLQHFVVKRQHHFVVRLVFVFKLN